MRSIKSLLGLFILVLVCNAASLAQTEEYEVSLQPVENYDIFSGGLKPVYKILDDTKLYYGNKKYDIKIPSSNSDFGVVYIYFTGNSESKLHNLIPVLVEDYKGNDPRFYMDANNNLDFTDDGTPKQYMDTMIRRFINFHRYVPFSIASSGENSRSFKFHLLETNDTSYYFLRKSTKSSKKMPLAETEYWYRNVRLTKKKGALKINDETFQIIFEDWYCSTNFSKKGNYFYTGPSDEDFGSLDKWRITESTVISLGSTNFKLKEIDPAGMKAVFVIADTDEKLRYHQNDTVRNFTFKLISGNKTSLNDYLGNNKKVLLYFWGTWCAPCRARHPEMKELYKNYQNKLEILAFANDKKNAVKKYIKENDISWPNAVPDNKFVGELMTKLNITGYPGYVLLDEHGLILMEYAHPESIEEVLEKD